jgi:hypothetical protein
VALQDMLEHHNTLVHTIDQIDILLELDFDLST